MALIFVRRPSEALLILAWVTKVKLIRASAAVSRWRFWSCLAVWPSKAFGTDVLSFHARLHRADVGRCLLYRRTSLMSATHIVVGRAATVHCARTKGGMLVDRFPGAGRACWCSCWRR